MFDEYEGKLYDMIVLLERVTTLNNHENAHHSDQIKMNLKSRLNRIEGQKLERLIA